MTRRDFIDRFRDLDADIGRALERLDDAALADLIARTVTGEPIVDCDWTNANRALASLAKIPGLNVPPKAAFGDTVYKLTLDRNLSEEGE